MKMTHDYKTQVLAMTNDPIKRVPQTRRTNYPKNGGEKGANLG